MGTVIDPQVVMDRLRAEDKLKKSLAKLDDNIVQFLKNKRAASVDVMLKNGSLMSGKVIIITDVTLILDEDNRPAPYTRIPVSEISAVE